MVPPLVAVALDYHRDPTAFERLRDLSLALPGGFPRMLADFSAALAAANIDDTAEGLSVTPAELEDAARFLIRHLLLDAPADYYRCLGVTRDASPDLIRAHYLLLSRILHPDRIPNATELDVQYARRLNQAYQVLHDPEARSRYDLSRGTGRRHRRPTDPRLFFRRRQPIVPRPASVVARPRPAILSWLRFIVPALLLAAVGTLFLMALWPPAELLGRSGSASPHPSVGSAAPRDGVTHQPGPGPLPRTSDDRYGFDAPPGRANAPEATAPAGSNVSPMAADAPPPGGHGDGLRETELTPAAPRTFPSIEFDPPGGPIPSRQPVRLNP